MRKNKYVKLLRRSLVTSATAGVLALAFVFTRVAGLSILSFLLLLFVLQKASKLTMRQFLRQSYLFGLVYFGIVMAWIYKIHATDLIPNNTLAIMFKTLTFLLIMSSMGTGFLLAGLLYRKLRIDINGRTALYIPAIWVVGEYFRSVFFSAFTSGQGGSIGPFWSFGTLGLTLTNTPLKYAGRVVGMYGMSILVIVVSLVFFRLYQRRFRWLLLLALPVILSFGGWLAYHQSTGRQLQVRAVGLGPKTEDGYEQALARSLVGKARADLTVLPEYSNFYGSEKRNDNKLPNSSGLVIDSRLGTSAQGRKNITTFYQPDGTILAERQKSFLIPGGEFVPYIYAGILVASGNNEILLSIRKDRSVYQSIEKEKPFTHKGVSYGALACSGAIAPNLYSRLVKQGAEVLVNSASISSLGVSDLYYKQASQMSAFIATSNARPFVQSARGGPSYILNKDGHPQTYATSPEQLVVLSSEIHSSSTKTIYSRYGEFMVGLSAAAVLARAFWAIPRQRNLKNVRKRR
ncbi:MAG TPA: hypothetical protein PKA02_02795 [Candidatus Saccharibacteria bacterium]|nr:hypothetical protein [Candidatus Saccharibacteria bacterium]